MHRSLFRLTSVVAVAFTLFWASNSVHGQETAVELGAVNWGRDLPAAKKLAEQTGKPILVLFQEVPG